MYQIYKGRYLSDFLELWLFSLTWKTAAVTLSLTILWEKVKAGKEVDLLFYTHLRKAIFLSYYIFLFEAHGPRVVHMFLLLLQRRLVKQATAIFSF